MHAKEALAKLNALQALLDRIESGMAKAPPAAAWTMNSCLTQIGIQFPPFAPTWIDALVRRQG